jgi:predicted RNA-binding Zn-ribbon protein involved in translation (DUF1610 family)
MSAFRFTCQQCRLPLVVDDSSADESFTCPNCRHETTLRSRQPPLKSDRYLNRFTVLGAAASLFLLVVWLYHWHKSGPQR